MFLKTFFRIYMDEGVAGQCPQSCHVGEGGIVYASKTGHAQSAQVTPTEIPSMLVV